MGFRTHVLAAITGGLGAIALTVGAASAAQIKITITNNQPSQGLYLTPLFYALHDGSFDPFDETGTASTAVEDLAEEGIAAGLIAEAGGFANGVITSPGGFPAAPVIDPGETASAIVSVNPMTERYLSFLSMVIPSNDNFIGNDNPLAYQIFDAAGQFSNIGPITVLGGDVWDAGTEQNTGEGAAFSTNSDPGVDEGGVILRQAGLDFLLGTETPELLLITSVPGAGDLLATISVSEVPVPAGLPLVLTGMGLLALARRKQRKAS